MSYKKEIEHLEKVTQSIEGFLSKIEGQLLYSLASHCPEQCTIVEIGSFKGKSTIWLGKALAKKGQGKIFAVDPHDRLTTYSTFKEFQTNIHENQLDGIVIPLVKISEEAECEFADNSLDMVFIDGDHSYEAVMNDIRLWLPKLKPSGFIAFHDSFAFGFPGTRKAVHETLRKSPHFCNVKYLDSITYATKTERATSLQRLQNHVTLMTKVLHERSASKDRRWPYPVRTVVRKWLWQPCRKKWLKEISSFGRQ